MRHRNHKVEINLFRSELWPCAPGDSEPLHATHNGYEFDCVSFTALDSPQRRQEVEDFFPEDSDSIQVKERGECIIPGVPFFKHYCGMSVGALYDVLINSMPLPKPEEVVYASPTVVSVWDEDKDAVEILRERALDKTRETTEALCKLEQAKIQKKLEREAERAKNRFKQALGIMMGKETCNCVLCAKEISAGYVWDDQHVCIECFEKLRRQIDQEAKDKSMKELVRIGAIDEHQMRPISEQQSQAYHCFSCGEWMRGSKHKFCCDACWALSEHLRS